MKLLKNTLVCFFIVIIATATPLVSDCQQLNNPDSLKIAPRENIKRLKPFRFITNVPGNMVQIVESPFHKNNLKGFLITLGATGLILPVDQPIANGIKHFSNQIHFHSETDYKIVFKVGDTKILKIPQNLNSALYQFGEGGTSMMLAGGLYLYGKIMHDKRSVYVASDLTETFITMGVTTQILKRISGRQSPFTSTDEGGVWKPFPKFKQYQVNTSEYDAFPSGHLATMMATVSTLVMDYPEKNWVKPVGYSLIGLTGLAMINTDVHWMSDYPLALALGYISAKITYKKNHPKPRKTLPLSD